MKLYVSCALLVLHLLFLPTSSRAQQVIINELYNSGGNDEWLELLVVQDSLDLRGWDLRDFSSGGVAQNPLTFSTNTLWSNVRSGTLIVVARPENTFPEDTDPSDYLLVIKSDNGLYFTGNVFSFAGSSDAVQIRTPSDVHVFGVSWGTSNQNSLPSPRVHFTGSSTSNTSISFNRDSLTLITNASNWTLNNTSPTRGAGNTPANAAWIMQLRGQGLGDGSGSARVVPDTLNGGVQGSVQVIYRRNTQYTVNALRIIVPPAFAWSRSRADVSYTNMTAVDTVRGDTIVFTNITFSADSTVITIANVRSPDSTAFYTFRVQSRQNTFADVTPLPRMVVFGAPVPIGEVKMNDANGIPLRLGQLVTIEGFVTVANEFGGPSFVQDNSGGIAIFGSAFSTAVTIGDEVKVSGVVSPFNGLSELTNPYLHGIISTGNSVAPVVATCSQLFNDGQGGVEEYEGRLVRVNLVHVIDTVSGVPPSTWNQCGSSSGCNYRLVDASGYVDIRADNNVNFFTSPVPQGTFSVIGVVSQFKPAPPFIGGYQLQPRAASDLLTSGPIIATTPVESNIQPTALTISWTTFNPGTTRLRYGRTTNYELGVLAARGDSTSTSHAITISSLTPATVYHVQAFSVAGADTSFASNLIVSTASQSTGVVNAYFNKSVNTTLAWFQPALGNQNLVQRLLPRINAAQRSIDVCLYSLSGTAGSSIAQALVQAKNRGVRVRVICEDDNRNTAPFNFLVTNGVPLITDRFDPINNGAGLMHNKFFVFDGRGGAAESVWVWTGSWNPTDPGTNDDYQNAIEFQDQAMANAYTLEFNEMWGSDTEVPNPSLSRFGVRKLNNTPHRFMVGGKSVEVYFSPSDGTDAKILAELNRAEHSIGFQLLTLTRSGLATALVNKKNAGKKVRGNLDDSTDTGSQYRYLVNNGVDVRLKTGTAGLLHHKYGIIDAEYPYWPNTATITGSHNWTNSAENANNENMVIVRDGNITNQYLQEFAARYYQFGGTDTIRVDVEEISMGMPVVFKLDQNYPNPFNPSTNITFTVPGSGLVTLKVYDVLGREVATLVHEQLKAGTYKVQFAGGNLASGVYFYRLTAGGLHATRKLMLLR